MQSNLQLAIRDWQNGKRNNWRFAMRCYRHMRDNRNDIGATEALRKELLVSEDTIYRHSNAAEMFCIIYRFNPMTAKNLRRALNIEHFVVAHRAYKKHESGALDWIIGRMQDALHAQMSASQFEIKMQTGQDGNSVVSWRDNSSRIAAKLAAWEELDDTPESIRRLCGLMMREIERNKS